MNRNSMSRYDQAPVSLNIERSRFPINHNVKGTFSNGDLIPIFKMMVLPGDTIEMDMAEICRMQTPIFPVMDSMKLDTYFFFVPHRLVMEHFEEFMGENKDGAWAQEVERTIPKITAPEGGWKKGTIADYFGQPTNIDGAHCSSLFFKSYVKLWNDWFRDQTRKEPALITMGDENLEGMDGTEEGYTYITGAERGGLPLKVARYKDVFTTSTPTPQKGPDVFIPLGGRSGTAPVVGNGMTLGIMQVANDNTKTYGGLYNLGSGSTGLGANIGSYGVQLNKAGSDGQAQAMTSSRRSGVTTDPEKSGLVALLDYSSGGTTTQSTINNLRTAFAIQRHYEKLRLGGSRYIEIVASIFGTQSADSRLQRAEYLGGYSTYINMESVVQSSETTETSPQGNVSGNSKTVFGNHVFTHSFTEHGYIIGVQATRVIHSYQQGTNRLDRAYDKFDLYWPSLAHIGEQPIYNYEIFTQGDEVVDSDGNIVDNQVAAYQEAWYQYRNLPNIITGELRSNYTQSLDAYHYADYYTELPILTSSEWIDEPRSNVDRTIAVDSDTADQFIYDINYRIKATRPMPVYSVPGLIDHY